MRDGLGLSGLVLVLFERASLRRSDFFFLNRFSPPILGSTPNGLDFEFAREKTVWLCSDPSVSPTHLIQGSGVSAFARNSKRSYPLPA